MNDRTYPLGVWEMYDEVKDLDRIEIINECFKKWWKYNEIQLLKQRIDKAIEYINSNGILDLNGYDLLDILRGEDNESN